MHIRVPFHVRCRARSSRFQSLCVPTSRGVLNIVHGTHDTVNRILDHKDIKAISFVGSDAAGRYIHERGSASGKRVQVRPPTCASDSGRLLLS